MATAALKGSANSARGSFLPPGATLFFRQRAMELLGVAVVIVGMAGLIALITYHATDPSLNRATGFAPNNLLGFAGAAFADVMMQGIGLGAFLLPVAAVAWGVMLARHHVLHFFGLRLALLLAAVLLAATAAGRFGDIGQWMPHAGPGGVTGAALAKYAAEIVLTYSDGGPLPVVAPLCGLFALALMVPVIGMRRGDCRSSSRDVPAAKLLRWPVARRGGAVARPPGSSRRTRVAARAAGSATPRFPARSTPRNTIPPGSSRSPRWGDRCRRAKPCWSMRRYRPSPC